jgi:hypothetical protein
MNDDIGVLGVDGPSVQLSPEVVGGGKTAGNEQISVQFVGDVVGESPEQGYWIKLHRNRTSGLK